VLLAQAEQFKAQQMAGRMAAEQRVKELEAILAVEQGAKNEQAKQFQLERQAAAADRARVEREAAERAKRDLQALETERQARAQAAAQMADMQTRLTRGSQAYEGLKQERDALQRALVDAQTKLGALERENAERARAYQQQQEQAAMARAQVEAERQRAGAFSPACPNDSKSPMKNRGRRAPPPGRERPARRAHPRPSLGRGLAPRRTRGILRRAPWRRPPARARWLLDAARAAGALPARRAGRLPALAVRLRRQAGPVPGHWRGQAVVSALVCVVCVCVRACVRAGGVTKDPTFLYPRFLCIGNGNTHIRREETSRST